MDLASWLHGEDFKVYGQLYYPTNIIKSYRGIAVSEDCTLGSCAPQTVA